MTHNSSGVIINALMSHPDISPEEMLMLEALRIRDKFTWRERWVLAWLTYRLLG